MSRLTRTIALAIALSVVLALPVLAADPVVNKSESKAYGENSVVLLTVTASEVNVHGVTFTGAAGSIVDIVSPEGWAGVTDGDLVTFHSVDKFIKTGQSATFRLLMKGSTSMSAVFFDEHGVFTGIDNI
jgi:hypothetical protein